METPQNQGCRDGSAVIPDDPSSGLSSHAGLLTVACNCSARESETLFLPPWGPTHVVTHTHTHTDMYTYGNTEKYTQTQSE